MATDNEQRTIEIVLKSQAANASINEMAAGTRVLTAQLNKMGQDDPGRAQLLTDLQLLNQRLTANRAEMRQVTQSAEDLAEAEAAAAAATEALARANEETVATGKKATASLTEMRAAAALLERELAGMSQDDPGRARLQQDFAQLSQRIGTTNTALRTLVKSEQELRQEQAQLAEENLRVVVSGQQVNASFSEMTASAALLERELHQLSADDPGRAQLLTDYRALQGRIADVREEMGATAPQASIFQQALQFAGVALTAEAVVDGVLNIGKSIFDTTAKFETYSAVMKNALGSESAAQLALHDIQTMAAKTPFSVDELTSSFIKFVNRGLKPSMEDMKKMADLAASQGKSFDQLTEAVLDAGTGEFERLKEFGIQASKSGDQVTLSFKNQQEVVANTPEAIQAALLSFGELNGVMGSTDAISATLQGQVSNLGDTADQVAIQYGTILKGAFVGIISVIGFFLGMLGALPGFLRENRGVLLALAGAVATLNIELIQSTAVTLADAVATKAGIVWKSASALATRAWTAAQTGLNVALAANPIGAVIAIGMLLVGVFMMLYDKSEKFRAVVSGLGQALMSFVTTYVQGVIKALTGLGDILIGVFTLDPARIKKGLEEVGGGVKAMYYDAGKNAAGAFSHGYNEKMATEQQKAVADMSKVFDEAWTALLKRREAASKARIAAEKAARMEALKDEEGELKIRLAQVEEGTREELRLKQQLIRVQANIELEDTKKSEVDKRLIRAEAQAKIIDLEKDFNAKKLKEAEAHRKKLEKMAEDEAKKEAEVQKALEDLRVGLVLDKNEREIREIDLQTNRKMAAIKGSAEQQQEQWELLEQERQDKINAVRQRQRDEEQAQKDADAAKAADMIAADEELYLAGLEEKVAAGLLAEQNYQDQLYEIKKAALERELELLVEKGKGESVEAKRIQAALLRGSAAHIAGEKNQQEELRKFKQSMNSASAAILTSGLSFLVDNLNKQGSAYLAFKNILKVAQIGEILINLQGELANNRAVASNPFNPLRLLPGGDALIATQLAVKNAAAYTNAGIGVATVAAFAKGGRTDKGAALPADMLVSMLSGASGGQQRTFAAGGRVEQATIGLIGEAGAELVIPNWLYADPKQANLMGFLESAIASRGGAFAAGGSTTGASPVAATSGEDTSTAMLDVLERIARGHDEFRQEVSAWQRGLEVKLDYRKVKQGLDVVDKIQNGGGIK